MNYFLKRLKKLRRTKILNRHQIVSDNFRVQECTVLSNEVEMENLNCPLE